MKYAMSLLLILPAVGCGEAVSPRTASSAFTEIEADSDQVPAEVTSMPEKVVRSEAEWRQLLTPEQYYVLREKGTEPPFNNKYDHHFQPGTYACAACGQVLFDAETKFNSGCGWPAFYAAKAGDRVQLTPDLSHGMVRTEVTCSRCDSHLGHIFDDAPQTPTGQRYCINSVSLVFKPASGEDASEEGK
jgi:peptide-methionine (R)-S-oxide reductase